MTRHRRLQPLLATSPLSNKDDSRSLTVKSNAASKMHHKQSNQSDDKGQSDGQRTRWQNLKTIFRSSEKELVPLLLHH